MNGRGAEKSDAAFAEDERRVQATCGVHHHARRSYVIEWEASGVPKYPCDLYLGTQKGPGSN